MFTNHFHVLIAGVDQNSTSSIVERICGDSKYFYTFEVAPNGKSALEKLEQNCYHVLVADYTMPDMTALELAEEMRRENLPSALVIVAASPTAQLAKQAVRAGADEFLSREEFAQSDLPTLFRQIISRRKYQEWRHERKIALRFRDETHRLAKEVEMARRLMQHSEASDDSSEMFGTGNFDPNEQSWREIRQEYLRMFGKYYSNGNTFDNHAIADFTNKVYQNRISPERLLDLQMEALRSVNDGSYPLEQLRTPLKAQNIFMNVLIYLIKNYYSHAQVPVYN